MRVFISWSGSKSQAVAEALREWLPGVINSVEPFVSSEDIYAGARWQSEIASQLDGSNFGIVCVTRDNQSSSWLNFEAGALAKALDVSRLIPLAVDLKPSDVKVPLGQFQAQPATKEGLRAVVVSINSALGEHALPGELLLRSFDKWWPELETELAAIESQTADAAPPARTERELLEETLNTVRAFARTIDQQTLGPRSSTEWLRKQTLATALRNLPDREREVLTLRFGLEDDEPKTLEAIGSRLRISRERVRQLEGQGLARLTEIRLGPEVTLGGSEDTTA
ncbi:MAG: sigma factor-like helix-turn-helix DNA-binding protein [Gaiellaceae bacterium]